jgi:hypothetical protein
MGKSLLGLSIILVTFFLSSSPGVASKERNLMEIPDGSVGMVAYGSLISLPGMEQTLGHKYKGPIHQVHLTGYERAWTCVRPWAAQKISAYILRDTERVPIIGAAELSIYPKKKGRVNGILYIVTDEELARFDKREHGYRRVDVTDRIEEFRFRGRKVYAYEGLPPQPVGPSPDKGVYIAIKEFIDMVAGACDDIGNDFRIEFGKTTRPCSYQIVPYKQVIWEEAK